MDSVQHIVQSELDRAARGIKLQSVILSYGKTAGCKKNQACKADFAA